MAARHPMVAREGWRFIFIVAAVAAAVVYFVHYLYALPLIVLLVALFYLYRDPPRKSPPLPLAVICPVDGYVTSVDNAQDPWLKRDAKRISISMSRSGVYSIRSPIEGKVMEQWNPDLSGGFHASWIQTDEKDDVVFGIETRGPRGPECYVQPGERIGQGHRCGFFFPGTSVDVYLPLNTRIEIEAGRRVASGVTVIATLIHNSAASIIEGQPNT
ncbi:MAG: phosphatidylserine decarboxylase [Gammaproteobacteria bacterium]|nr:phosphatidylserine decarboxylase [Gammaproteobacteria bacterium]